jgi:hydrogenase maturation protease
MARALVIGYGNPLRGDDGLGWRAAESILKSADSSSVEVITCHQLSPELAEAISRAAFVVFVDAEHAPDSPPGTLVETGLEPECHSPQCFSHALVPATLLACAAELFGSTPRAKLLSIVGADFSMGERLSPAVEARLPELIERIHACIKGSLMPA